MTRLLKSIVSAIRHETAVEAMRYSRGIGARPAPRRHGA